MHFHAKYLFATIAIVLGTNVFAHEADGTWVFEKSLDHDGVIGQPAPPPTNRLDIRDGVIVGAGDCNISLVSQVYYPGGPFQALLRGGAEESAIGSFLGKNFDFELSKIKTYYTGNPSAGCTSFFKSFLISPTRLIAIRSGVIFYGFKRSATETATQSTQHPPADLQGLKVTPLPFKVKDYIAQCAGQWPTKNGIPIPSGRCAPAYFPAVASKGDKSTISYLIGSHDYQKGGARNESGDYNNPVANGLHPLYLVLPPYGETLLIRVDDMEKAEERDVIKGAYLAIKNGRVTDQLNVNCDFDAKYACTDRAGNQFQLTTDGQFKKVR